MRKYIIALALAAVTMTPALGAPPRIRTSAPPEKTAQLTKGNAPAAQKQQSASTPAKQQPAAKAEAGVPKFTTPRFMAVKTNIAYDAFAILNAEFEIQVARHFSVDIPVIWSLWDWKRDMGLRVVGVQPEARYWFGRVGKGNAVGVNLGIASYNFRHDDVRTQNVSNRPLLSAAVSYAYVLPIDSHWSAEFSLAVGYANMRYNRYYNIDNGALINTKDRHYFGPTKVGITLSYRLGK